MTADGTTGYVWNAENQLASVSTPSGTTTYTYDALGRRVTIGSEHLGYIGSSDLVSYVTDANDNVVQRFTYNAAGLPILMSMAQGGSWYTYAYVYDGLGQIVGLIDETPGSATLGQEVATYTYDAWGNLLSHTDTSGTGVATSNPFLYKGYWYDWSTGLYDLNARYYNPALGRFLSVDPVGAQVGSGAPGYNGYAYASNNPVNRVDPSGMLDTLVSNIQRDKHIRINSADVANFLNQAATVVSMVPFPESEAAAEALSGASDLVVGLSDLTQGMGELSATEQSVQSKLDQNC